MLEQLQKNIQQGSAMVAKENAVRASLGWKQYMVDIPLGKSGDWSVEHYTVTKQDEEFQMLRAACNPQREARWVPAGTYTRLVRDGVIVMSDTPDEIKDHMAPIRRANGHCIVAGLGLGMVAEAMLKNKQVTKVTVLEMSKDVIKLVGTTLKKRYGDRLEIIHCNALEWKPPRDAHYGCAWFDIWDNISEENLPEMGTFNRRFARKADWKGAWQQEGCIAQRDRVRSGRGWY